MRRWSGVLWILVLVGLAISGCPQAGTTELVLETGTPTSQPAAIDGPNYDTGLLDPLTETSAGAEAVAVGDIDGDGNLDLASVSDESQRVQIHLYKATTGSFDTITIAGGAPLSFLSHVELVDLNGDGKLDIVVLVKDTGFAMGTGGSTSGALGMLIQGTDPRTPSDWTQLPTAGDAPPSNLAFAGGDEGPTALLVGELDGKNGPDIVVLSNDSQQREVHLFANPGPANVTDVTAWNSTIIESDIVDFAEAALADLDGDGDQDVVMTVPTSKSFNLRWLQNPLRQSGTQATSTIPNFVSDQADPLLTSATGATVTAVGKIDDDDYIDIASISGASQPVQIHLWNTATDKFDTISIASGPPLRQLIDIELVDLNRDGKLDIALLASDTGLATTGTQAALILIFQGNDAREPTQWTQIPGAGESPPANLAFANAVVTDLVIGDTDGQNGDDVVVVSEGSVRLFPNPGDANATDRTAWVASVIETDVVGQAKARLGDLDADGDQDVVMCDPGATDNNVRWLQNPLIGGSDNSNAPPTFLSDLIRPDLIDPLFESTAGAKAVWIGDIDGDGMNDVASISDENQAVQIHLWNTAENKFDSTISIAGGAPLALMVDVELVDLDLDGKLDIAVLVTNTSYAPPLGYQKTGALVLLIQGDDPQKPEDWTQVDPDTLCYGDEARAGCDMRFLTKQSDALAGVTDLAIGDVDGDAYPDIVVTSNEIASPPAKYVYLFTNPVANITSAASWSRTVIDTNGANYSEVKVGNVNGDGDLDVVACAPESISLNVRWLENSAGGTTWTRRVIGQQEGGGDSIALGDIDDDGDLDLAAYGVGVALAQWFRNPGDTFLATNTRVPWDVFNIGELDDTSADIQQVQLVDLDGDSELDCFVTREGVAVGFRRQDDVENTWESFQITSTDSEIGRVGFADFDNDNRLDFLAPLDYEGLTSDRIAFYTTVTNNRWRRRAVGHQDGGGDLLALGDVNGGGMDVVVASQTGRLVQWFKNPGSTTLAGDTDIPWNAYNMGDTALLGGGDITQVELSDLDVDGALDCFITANVATGVTSTTGTIAWFRSPDNVEETWETFSIETPDPVAEIGQVSLADVGEPDQRTDLIVPLDRDGLTQDEFVIYLAEVQSGTGWLRRLVAQQQGGAQYLSVGDIDGDGNIDVASSRVDRDFVQWFRNPGAANLAPEAPQVPWDVYNIGELSDLEADTDITQIQLVDLDSNNTLDCFVSAGGKGYGFQRQNDIEDWWVPFTMFETDPVANIGHVGFADFNGDGELDFVAPLDRIDPLDSSGQTQDQFILFIHE